MKVVLLITSCKQNGLRIQNQLTNLKNTTFPLDVEFIPIFLFGHGGIVLDAPYKTLIVNVEEKYTNLYKKLFEAYKEIDKNYDYDFICKIDDDTKLNLEKFDVNWILGKDYIGRMFPGNTQCSITLNLEFCNMYKTINLKPEIFNSNFKYATGDCYFISKRAVKYIINSENVLDGVKSNINKFRINEDKLFGYILHSGNMIFGDINMMNDEIQTNSLQVTTAGFTIHPINETLYPSLIGINVGDQLSIIYDHQFLNLVKRRADISNLEKELVNTIEDFLNSKRTIGLG